MSTKAKTAYVEVRGSIGVMRFEEVVAELMRDLEEKEREVVEIRAAINLLRKRDGLLPLDGKEEGMAGEVLSVPEEHLREVIAVLRAGLAVTRVKRETRRALEKWCRDEQRYLERLEEE